MIKKYYYENTPLETKYATLWDGYLTYEGNIPISSNYWQNSNKELDDILADICDVNFYVSIIDNNIYLSVSSDFRFYITNFEKTIKKAIKEINDKFNVKIGEGHFNALEIKHSGNQYRYIIRVDEKDKDKDKYILKKKTLNWGVLDNDLVNNLKKLSV